MLFWNLEPATIRRPEYVGADPVQRATWLNVGLYSVEQENGGRVVGARAWGDRRWQQTCGVTLAEVDASAPLLTWEGNDLLVWAYPEDKEQEVRDGRHYGALGGQKSAEIRRAKAAERAAANTPAPPSPQPPLNPPSTPPATPLQTPSPQPPLNGKERKGKERNGKKRKETESPIVPKGTDTDTPAPSQNASGLADAADGRKPATFEILAAFVSSLGAPVEVAQDIFDHYQANGWKQGGRAALVSWQAAASKWARGWVREQAARTGQKISSGGGAPAGGGGSGLPQGAGGVCLPDPPADVAAAAGGAS